MKKFTIFTLVLLLTILSACTKEDPKEEEKYDPRSLVPTECETIENIGEWQPVWCEEFSVDGLPNQEKWNYETGGYWHNNEIQYYTGEDLDNTVIEDGVLSINVIKETYENREYTSSRITTRGHGDWLYGRVQIRAKVASGRGAWPALWFMPTNSIYGGWPDSGEIDLMEHVGYDADTIFHTIHTEAYNHSLGTQIGFNETIVDAETAFHVYEMIWQPGSILMFIDGIKTAEFAFDPEDNIGIENSAAWPFDKQFYLIMNVAFGGDWGGAQGIDETLTSSTMEVDYVRVFQKDYEALDQAAPKPVENIRVLETKSNRVQLTWDEADDDVLVKEYQIKVNGLLRYTESVPSVIIDNLNAETSYEISITAIDFAGKESEETIYTVSTSLPPLITSQVEAENYNTQSGIQIQPTTDTGGGFNIGWTDEGDYLTYILRVAEAGTYVLDLRVASETDQGSIGFFQENTHVVSQEIPQTGGWQSWLTVTTESFSLQPGTYTFKLSIENGGFNVNYFECRRVN